VGYKTSRKFLVTICNTFGTIRFVEYQTHGEPYMFNTIFKLIIAFLAFTVLILLVFNTENSDVTLGNEILMLEDD
jgi:hypothetical protein